MTRCDFSLFNLLADCVLVIDQEFTIVFANQAFAGIYGLAAQEVIGRKCYEVSHNRLNPCDEQSLQGTLCCCAEIFGTARPMTQTHCHTMPDGTQKTFAITASPITDSAGEVQQIIQVIKDITEQEELRKAAQRDRRELERILDSAPFAIAYVDREMRVVWINSATEQITGVSASDAVGQCCYEIYGQHARDTTKKGREKICDLCNVPLALENGNKHIFERSVGDRVLEILTVPVKDEEGRIVGALEIGRDITECRQAELDLRFSNMVLKTQQETSQDGILVVDALGKMISFNQRFIDMWGIPQAVIETGADDLAITSVLHKLADPERFVAKIRHLYANPDEKSRDELVLRDGRVFDRFSAPMIGPDYKHYGRIWYFSDITDRKLAEKKMLALAMRLEEVQEAERHRLARELHDNVGQKLTALGINLQILSNKMQSEENSRFQPRLADSMELVEDISEQTRSIMADLRPPVLDDYGIMAGLRWLGHKFANMAGLEVVVEGREPQPRLASHKEIALYRIVQEALTNTIKHAQARSFRISLAMRGKSVCLRLADDGKGFEMKRLKESGLNAGWGLMSMKERTEALNGRFVLETAPGHGTQITVEVPL